jgi:hypothetical protein
MRKLTTYGTPTNLVGGSVVYTFSMSSEPRYSLREARRFSYNHAGKTHDNKPHSFTWAGPREGPRMDSGSVCPDEDEAGQNSFPNGVHEPWAESTKTHE